jgi:hypothetical protein
MGKKINVEIVKFCAIECFLQRSGELSIGWMIDAWLYAQEQSKSLEYYGPDEEFIRTERHLPSITDVLEIGRLVEPNVNANGFRKCGVRVGYDVKMDWQEVPRCMVNLMEALREPPYKDEERGISIPVMTPDKFFREYEEIHPFRDGNGRSGAILYNWLNGTLDYPVWAPNYWNDPRRTVGFGA